MEGVLDVASLLALLGIASAVLALAGVVGSFAQAYRRPPLQPGDVVYVSSFGQVQRCFVVDVDAEGVILIAPVPDAV